MQRNRDKLPLGSIATDARWREGLVLFCEVADEPVAREIAEFCWRQVRGWRDPAAETGSDARRHALHSLRFLVDAFRARRDLIASFEPALAEQIERDVRDPDMLLAKHALEASGILSDAAAQRTIAAALSSGNAWLIDTAFRACRYLPAPSWTTRLSIMDRLLSIAPVEHLKTYREIMFCLRSVEGMKIPIWFYRSRHLDVAAFPLIVSLFIVTLPVHSLYLLGLLCILYLFALSESTPRHQHATESRDDGRTVAEQHVDVFLSIIHKLLGPNPYQGTVTWITKDYLRCLSVAAFITVLVFIEDVWYVRFFIEDDISPEPLWLYLHTTIEEQAFLLVALIPFVLSLTLLRPITLFLIVGRFVWRLYGVIADQHSNESFFSGLALLMIAGVSILSIIPLYSTIDPYINKLDDCIICRQVLWLISLIFLIIIPTGISIGILSMPYLAVSNAIKERRAFRRAIQMSPTRVQIHACFLGLATERYRLKYVRWLEANCQQPPTDAWPERRPPNVNNDEASIELAKLEERWLGLD